VPVFTSGELSALERTCRGRNFAQRRDAAVIAVLKASGIRAGELAGIRYDPHDASRADLDLWQREITVRGVGGGSRVVRIGHEAGGHAQVQEERDTRVPYVVKPGAGQPGRGSDAAPASAEIVGFHGGADLGAAVDRELA
jgi:integrase